MLPVQEPESNPPHKVSIWRRLPFSPWLPLVAGVLTGIALRLLFSGNPGGAYATMMGAFIFLSPALVGVVTVYVAETIERRSWAYYVWAPFIANVLYVMGTLLILVEGVICAILIVPLFAAIGALAGVIMGAVCRITNWPKRVVYGVAFLPVLLGAVEHHIPLPDRIRSVERAVSINASADSIWWQINNARDIQPHELDRGWAYRIGVPLPVAGITQLTPAGPVRKITMGKGIHFDQIFSEWQDNRYVRWTYRFYDDSFPRHALDDHVTIGGHYFDIVDTSYTLIPRGAATELKLRMQYRVSTPFNWYADAVAQMLLGNVEEVILDFYRLRSESMTASRLAPRGP